MSHWTDTIGDGFDYDDDDCERDAREDEPESADVTLSDGRCVTAFCKTYLDDPLVSVLCDGVEILETLTQADYEKCMVKFSIPEVLEPDDRR